MRLSYVIVTHNRREPLLATLRHLHAHTPLGGDQWEAWVVDNASTDGTRDAVAAEFPGVRHLARSTNEGVWARSLAFEPARGEYLILLDDDSYPIGDAVRRSLKHLDTHPECAAVVGKVLLPDGSQEGCAFPGVMLSGAVCIRRSVLLEVGGFRREFFRKAGEYDLSFRIWNAGYRVDRFEDVVYRHDKVLTGRSKPFAHRMDLRNNLILVERYLPSELRREVRQDIVQRYSALARHDGCSRAALQARVEGACWRLREALTGRQTLTPPAIETLYQLEEQARRVSEWSALY
ncbi:glycosyltransferase family 2 protein, partial [Cyanobium sp. Cruz-8H5]|uniref:glycosyltransferase family 2 protein n=1 Tax=Cyanobium sp. Cruz-8H5 TaxID=2823712 RepID=UPI0020CE0E14